MTIDSLKQRLQLLKDEHKKGSDNITQLRDHLVMLNGHINEAQYQLDELIKKESETLDGEINDEGSQDAPE